MSDSRSSPENLRVALRAIIVEPMGGPLVATTGNARSRYRERRGLLVRAHDDNGRVGLGEASPLPGYSPDTLAQCHDALDTATSEIVGPIGLLALESACQTLAPPAARFALETALLDLLAQAARMPVADLLARHLGRPVQPSVPVCALVALDLDAGPRGHDLAVEQALGRVQTAYERGVRTFKIKIGNAGAFAAECAFLRALRQRYGDRVRLRLDVNRAWTQDQAHDNLERLAGFSPEFVEEPCPDLLALGRAPVPLCADESLHHASDADIDALLARDALAAVTLKPMVLGSLVRTLRLAARAEACGVRAIVSHLLDGPVAFAAYAQGALLCDDTPGLDRHPGLQAFPAVSLANLATLATPGRPPDVIRHSTRPGLGLGARCLDQPRDQLSVAVQRRQSPERPGIITADATLSYADLDDRVAGLDIASEIEENGLLSVVAERNLATLTRLYYGFEDRIPVVLLHPRASQRERAEMHALARTLTPEDWQGPDPASSLCLVLFTSGSRGRPRGVLIERHAILASARASAVNLGWRDDDRWLCTLPLAHVGGLSIVTRCLLAGRTVVLTPEGHFDAQHVAEFMARTRVTLASFVPTMLSRLLDSGWSPPAHLRAVLLGGGPASTSLLRRARERGVPVLTTYGMTETCSQVCTSEYRERDSSFPDPRPLLDVGAGCVGRPLPGVELELRDTRIFVRGPMLMRGYLGARNPIDERGFLDTGDHGRIDAQGCLWVAGRADDTIITGAENVDPAMVEEVLASHPSIRAVCVFAVPDEIWGQLVAMAVVADRALDADQMRDFVGRHLPAHQRPRRWCQVPEIPITRNHKVARHHVAQVLGAKLTDL